MLVEYTCAAAKQQRPFMAGENVGKRDSIVTRYLLARRASAFPYFSVVSSSELFEERLIRSERLACAKSDPAIDLV
jgi:hypothetical protein